MNIVLLGLPGAGKGTQAKKLSKKYNITHISTGDIFRNAMKKETSLGKKAKSYMDAGELVPDKITIGLMENRIKNSDDEDFIFDGFPRTLKQAEALTDILDKTGEKINLCIFIKVDEQELIERISGRRICEDCGAIYHIKFNPPEKDGICDKCGGSLKQRADDKEEIVRNRIKENRKPTMELVNYYRERGVLETVVGTGKVPDEVFEKTKVIVGEYLQ